ncbi:hypothetical protein EG68_11670 [Paragonimus skrjabini miyazakii]|uniref:Uncharacterized protein n=1 Tax=Paragonimus skrjabini miyazakii TaxID=59628 RepID=A0A8S9YH85_9TREM|nr:hypothetical protein EG68_11670 [Paragonimus skrjabini miyazakii]
MSTQMSMAISDDQLQSSNMWVPVIAPVNFEFGTPLRRTTTVFDTIHRTVSSYWLLLSCLSSPKSRESCTKPFHLFYGAHM